MADDLAQLASMLKVLAVPRRLQILQLLRQRSLCVNALVARLGVTQGAVSQHLRVLREAGLVCDQRRGCRVHYQVCATTLELWRQRIGDLLGPQSSQDRSSPADGAAPERAVAADRASPAEPAGGCSGHAARESAGAAAAAGGPAGPTG